MNSFATFPPVIWKLGKKEVYLLGFHPNSCFEFLEQTLQRIVLPIHYTEFFVVVVFAFVGRPFHFYRGEGAGRCFRAWKFFSSAPWSCLFICLFTKRTTCIAFTLVLDIFFLAKSSPGIFFRKISQSPSPPPPHKNQMVAPWQPSVQDRRCQP